MPGGGSSTPVRTTVSRCCGTNATGTGCCCPRPACAHVVGHRGDLRRPGRRHAFESLGGGFSVESALTTKYLVLSTIGAVIAGTITEPFAAAIALLYTDQRMRRERLDIEPAGMAPEPHPSNVAP